MEHDIEKANGRPTDYKPEYDELAKNYALLGATDKQIAVFFDVSEVTINAWKKKYPSFLKSLKEGKEQADAMVAQSLFRRAIGYSHPEDDIRTVSIGDGQGSEIVITPTTKHYAPDTTACIFWLKNRQREQWRDKQEHSIEATVTNTSSASELSDDELAAIAALSQPK
jgi:hypothetical protein